MKILMLGNSATYLNELPHIMKTIVGGTVIHITQGKASLKDFLDKSTNVGYLLNKVKDDGWDYVVLQDLTLNPSTNPVEYRENILAITEIGISCKEFVIFENWAYKDGNYKLQQNGLTHRSMYLLTKKACEDVAKDYNMKIARIGELFYRTEKLIDLYADDGCHPNVVGSTIAAYVIADTISGSDMTQDYLNTIRGEKS